MNTVASIDFSRLGPAPGTRMVVVGGCGGIGRSLVKAGLDIGLRIAVLDLPSSLEGHPPPNTCFSIALNATDKESVSNAFRSVDETWGGADVMVNLCGYTNNFASVSETELDSWTDVTDGNLRSAFLCAKAAIPLLRKSTNVGTIVNTASGLAFKGMPGTASYGAAKAGIIALSKSLAQECAPDIRVNVIAPGAVNTAFLKGGTGRGGEDDGRETNIDVDHYSKITPLKRLAVTDDIVGPIIFLTGDASRFMTGQVIHINGGGYMP